MRILVTGASGFLGRYVVDALAEAGHAVRTFDLQPAAAPSAAEIMAGDVTDPAACAAACAGMEAGFHCAGIADIEDCNADPVRAVRVNVMGTAALLDAARANGVGFFAFASSLYAASRLGGVYRTTKMACESLVANYRDLCGMEFVNIRFGTLYGPGADARNSVRRYVAQAPAEGQINYHGDGEEMREYIHVADAAKCCVRLFDVAERNRTVVVTGLSLTKVSDLFLMIGDILGKPLKIVYGAKDKRKESHYRITPFSHVSQYMYKIVPNEAIDLGQGVLSVVEEIADTRGALS